MVQNIQGVWNWFSVSKTDLRDRPYHVSDNTEHWIKKKTRNKRDHVTKVFIMNYNFISLK